MNRNDGGPAFPGHMVRVAGEMERAYEGGMSLRAHYAGQFGASLAAVLTVQPRATLDLILTKANADGCSTPSEFVAREACRYADALIAELAKGGAS
jgi:hypothetical protein